MMAGLTETRGEKERTGNARGKEQAKRPKQDRNDRHRSHRTWKPRILHKSIVHTRNPKGPTEIRLENPES